MITIEEHKCKECKWLIGERTSVGVECMQPDKQKKWNKTPMLWAGELRRNVARYKQPSALVCKKFEPID